MNIENLKGVGPKLLTILEKININSVESLLEYYPYRYNFINIEDIHNLNDNGYVKGVIIDQANIFYIKKNLNRLSFKAYVNNEIINVAIFNRAFIKNLIVPQKEVILYGKFNKLKKSFMASDIRFDMNINSIEPVYHLTDGLKKSILNKLIDEALKYDISEDFVPSEYNDKYNFISKKDAVKIIHRPTSTKDIKLAELKLIYEELFTFMFKINYLKLTNSKAKGLKRNVDIKEVDEFISRLPFVLTTDQLSTIKIIFEELNSEYRMNRLVLGDVGSGKTIVAIVGMYINYLSGYQSALMAPTEILAAQHYKTLSNLLENYNINIAFLTGKTKKREKEEIYRGLEEGTIDIIIGTHALTTDKVTYHNLGLVITDEQHRFGVNHRLSLQNKGISPDVLYLSATPIPRTYALTIYGDLDISMIKTKPIGRKEVKTILKKESEIKSVLYHMLEELKNNHQIYVVSPLIDNNENQDLKSVNDLKDKFKLAFKNVRIEILHGKLTQSEKDKIMNDFKNGDVKILISTTVIEVGVDVSNATMMVIYNAERFGLATLHQLRGRVGRNELQSYCYLISDYDKERLHVLEDSNDGFYISEKDFELRGAGDLFGVKQSGDMVFKIADLKRDYRILLQAQKDSNEYIINKEYLNNSFYSKIVDDIKFIN